VTENEYIMQKVQDMTRRS